MEWWSDGAVEGWSRQSRRVQGPRSKVQRPKSQKHGVAKRQQELLTTDGQRLSRIRYFSFCIRNDCNFGISYLTSFVEFDTKILLRQLGCRRGRDYLEPAFGYPPTPSKRIKL